MSETEYIRVANSSLSQHVGKPVTLLGVFDQLEPSGRMFTLKTSQNSTVTIQLQEPMRALKLHPDDSELFDHHLDGEKHAFFRSHLPAFKRMWNDEGKVYWLRFLLTFKMEFESNLYHKSGGHRLVNSIFIYIHKQFVEGPYSAAKNFIENTFIAAKHFHNLPEQSFTKNPFYTRDSREAFRTLLGKPDLDDEIPVSIMGFVCSVYFEFTSAVCTILKKWLLEPDLSEDQKQKIDYTLFYWKPCSEWEEKKYVAGCFEKYLASYWKEELPKMLLTCDIHNIFNNHSSENCCDNARDMNVFELLKDRPEPSNQFSIPYVKLIKPTVVACAAHNNCRLKILHDDKCLEPYLCEGLPPCVVTCEVTSKRRNQSKEVNLANPWKKLIVETFATKDASRRTVSTLAQSDYTQIETYLHEKEGAGEEIKECDLTNAEDFFCMHDAELRNAYNQQKRKEQLKKRLRSKLNKKYCFDPADYEEPDFCWAMYEQAKHNWIRDMCEGNFKNVVNSKCHEDVEIHHATSFACVRRALTSVAVGTGDLVVGRVVNPSVLHSSESNTNCSQPVEKEISKTKPKKSKSKKKKANGTSSNKPQNDSASQDLESTSGCPVSQNSDVKVESDIISSSPSLLLDKLVELNESISEIKNDVKINSATSVKTENAEAVIKNKSPANDAVLNSDKSIGNNMGTEKTESVETGEISEVVDKALLNNFPDTKNTDVSFQSVTEVGCKAESSAKDTLNIAEYDSITSVLQDFHNDNIQCDKMRIATNTSEVDDISTDVNKRSNVEKFLASIGITDESSPLLRITVSEALIKNAAFQVSENGIPEYSEEVETTVNSVDEFLSLIGVIKKPTEELDEKDSACQEPADIQVKEVEDTEKKVKLRTCAFCGKKEVLAKSFKRCARCKIEKFVQQRYYCSRSCQLEDWEESHRDEHSRKSGQL